MCILILEYYEILSGSLTKDKDITEVLGNVQEFWKELFQDKLEPARNGFISSGFV